MLDLYAGTGALGIEALSRGAAWCDFVEQDRATCRIIAENLAHTRLAGRGRRSSATPWAVWPPEECWPPRPNCSPRPLYRAPDMI